MAETQKDVAIGMLADGASTTQVLNELHARFPGTTADRARVHHYRWLGRSEGRLTDEGKWAREKGRRTR